MASDRGNKRGNLNGKASPFILVAYGSKQPLMSGGVRQYWRLLLCVMAQNTICISHLALCGNNILVSSSIIKTWRRGLACLCELLNAIPAMAVTSTTT